MSIDRDSSPPEETTVDRRLVAALTVAFILVASVIAAALYLRQADDGCGRWEEQLNELSSSLTRHRRAKGTGRIAAVEDLESLKLPCKKVGEARDVCAAAYRHIVLAEREQKRAKATVGRIHKAVASLEEPHKTVALRRMLQNDSIHDIAEELDLTEEEAQLALTTALAKLGPDRLTELHKTFEKAIKESDRHIKVGTEQNDACDVAFKRLLEDAQSR